MQAAVDPVAPGRLPARITLVLVACAALIVGNAVSLWVYLHDLERAATNVNQIWATIGKLRLLRSTLALADGAQQDWLLSGEPQHLDGVRANLAVFEETLQQAAILLRTRPDQAGNLAALERTAATKRADLTATAWPGAAVGRAEALYRAQSAAARERTEAIHVLLLEMIGLERARVASSNARVFGRSRTANPVGITIGAVTLVTLVMCYVLIVRNTRRLRVAEASLQRANQALEARIAARTEQLSSLSRPLMEASEREKTALARELHDELGSNLTAINLDVASVATHLEQSDPVRAARLTHALGVLRDTVDLKRRVIQGLRPGTLDNLGLVETLRMHVEDYTRRTGLPCTAALDESLGDLDPTLAIALSRVAQEALTNVAKYARASHVTLCLERLGKHIHLVIIDDGVGIDADAPERPLSHGLLGMRERIGRLNGQLSIRRGYDGRGTIVEAVIGLDKAPPHRRAADRASRDPAPLSRNPSRDVCRGWSISRRFLAMPSHRSRRALLYSRGAARSR
jgi:signal transduction histidine kinase